MDISELFPDFYAGGQKNIVTMFHSPYRISSGEEV